MPAYLISRSIQVGAPVDQVFARVRDFRQWPEWSPWLIVEPDCVVSYAEDGRSYSWEGDVVGCGRMKILGEDPPSRIHYRLEFLKPWKSVSEVEFRFEEVEDGVTEVTWTMDGRLPFFLFFLKQMMMSGLGMDFERGLTMLKDTIETGSVPFTLEFGEQLRDRVDFVGVKSGCALSRIGPEMESGFARLKSWFSENGIETSGPPMSIYHKWDLAKQETVFTLAFPVDQVPAEVPDDLRVGSQPAMNAFVIRHTGPYRYLGNAWAAGMMRVRAKTFRQRRGIHPFEEYETDPGCGSEKDAVTVVHFPVRES